VAERPVRTGDDGERGSAVLDFVMILLLIVALLLAVLQVAVYVHVRNVVTRARRPAPASPRTPTSTPRPGRLCWVAHRRVPPRAAAGHLFGWS
jgi:hypothetical protein